MTTPPIGRTLAIAICEDEYTGQPALDSPSFQGATDSARSGIWDDYEFVWDDETGRLEAVGADGEGYFWGPDGWETY